MVNEDGKLTRGNISIEMHRWKIERGTVGSVTRHSARLDLSSGDDDSDNLAAGSTSPIPFGFMLRFKVCL